MYVFRAAVVAVMAFSAVIVSAQATSQRINEIKRAGKCFFAEATTPSREEARTAATQMLAYYINEYIKDNGLSHEPVPADNVPGVNYLEMSRGSNIRVFAYTNRSNITGEISETPTPAPAAASPDVIAEESDVHAEMPSAPAPSPEISPVSEEIAPAAPEIAIAVGDGSLTAAQDTLLTDLSKAHGIMEAAKLLGRAQAEYLVKRWGPYNKCPNRTWANWLIYDSEGKELEAMLSQGADGQRYDMISRRETESLESYLGNGRMAVFFEWR